MTDELRDSTEPTPFQRFKSALCAAMEAEGATFIEDELHRIAVFMARWVENNAPTSASDKADDWHSSMLDGE